MAGRARGMYVYRHGAAGLCSKAEGMGQGQRTARRGLGAPGGHWYWPGMFVFVWLTSKVSGFLYNVKFLGFLYS
jgi:hypothetical protein